jgi:integrase
MKTLKLAPGDYGIILQGPAKMKMRRGVEELSSAEADAKKAVEAQAVAKKQLDAANADATPKKAELVKAATAAVKAAETAKATADKLVKDLAAKAAHADDRENERACWLWCWNVVAAVLIATALLCCYGAKQDAKAAQATAEDAIAKADANAVEAKRQAAAPADLPGLLSVLPPDLLPIVLWISLTGCRQGYARDMRQHHLVDGAVIPDRGGKHRRVYRLDDALRSVLDLAAAHKRRLACQSDAIFVNSVGSPWTDSGLCQRIKAVWPAGITLHSLRHMWATQLARDVQPFVLQAAMGHRSVQSAIPYVHLAEEAVAQEQGSSALRSTLAAQIASDERSRGFLPQPAIATDSARGKCCPHCGRPWPQKQLLRKRRTANR